MYKAIFTLSFIAVLGIGGYAQTSYPFKVSFDRMLWHENIDKQQKRLLNPEGTVRFSTSETNKAAISGALVKGVDRLQQKIEFDSALTGQAKTKYLRTLELMVKGFADKY